MTVYLTIFHDGDTKSTYSIGVFTTKQKALDAFDYFMSDYSIKLIDCHVGNLVSIYSYIDIEDTDIQYNFEIHKIQLDEIIS